MHVRPEGEQAAPCPTPQSRADREEDAQELIELLEQDASVFAEASLPGWKLRQVIVPGTATEDAVFLYGPIPVMGDSLASIARDAAGAWYVAQDDRVKLPKELPVLKLDDLRHGPASVARIAQATAPDVSFSGMSLLREEDCRLTWLISGFTRGAEARPEDFVTGAIDDAAGTYEQRERSDVTDRP